jgi:hypothetical protein
MRVRSLVLLVGLILLISCKEANLGVSDIGLQYCDFKDPQCLSFVRQLADELRASHNLEDLKEIEAKFAEPANKPATPIVMHLAIKLAISKTIMHEIPPFHVSVIIPAYGETIRVKPRGTGENQDPRGENFVVEKHKQLEWLFKDSPSSYEVIFVDDMSQTGTSGEAIQRAINENQIPKMEVIFLEAGVRFEKEGSSLVSLSLRGIEFPKNTKKAGAVYYGSAKAISQYEKPLPHVLFITDCDLSVDVAQVGILVYPVITKQTSAVAGSRRLPTSILQIESSRNLRADAARYFRKLLLPDLPLDTQCGAKVIDAEMMEKVIRNGVSVLDYSFDVELLTLINSYDYPEKTVQAAALAWFDSNSLTTTDGSVHYGLLKTQHLLAQKLHPNSQNPLILEALRISGKLCSSLQTWSDFLTVLSSKPELHKPVSNIDPVILPELESCINKKL